MEHTITHSFFHSSTHKLPDCRSRPEHVLSSDKRRSLALFCQRNMTVTTDQNMSLQVTTAMTMMTSTKMTTRWSVEHFCQRNAPTNSPSIHIHYQNITPPSHHTSRTHSSLPGPMVGSILPSSRQAHQTKRSHCPLPHICCLYSPHIDNAYSWLSCRLWLGFWWNYTADLDRIMILGFLFSYQNHEIL